MHSLAVFALLVALVLIIGALAIAGLRRARLMSREHLNQLHQSGQAERIAHPKTRQDHFLRPLSLKDTVLGLVGAALLVFAVQAVHTWLGW
jgi:hypothetical protein